MGIGEVAARIVLKSMEIFSEERKRHFSAKYMDLQQAIKNAENAQSPDYSDAKLALAKEELEIFLRAYQNEFNIELDSLLKKVVSNA